MYVEKRSVGQEMTADCNKAGTQRSADFVCVPVLMFLGSPQNDGVAERDIIEGHMHDKTAQHCLACTKQSPQE